jgi:hypothetical protein
MLDFKDTKFIRIHRSFHIIIIEVIYILLRLPLPTTTRPFSILLTSIDTGRANNLQLHITMVSST